LRKPICFKHSVSDMYSI